MLNMLIQSFSEWMKSGGVVSNMALACPRMYFMISECTGPPLLVQLLPLNFKPFLAISFVDEAFVNPPLFYGLQVILERFRNTGYTDCSGLQGIYVLMHKADMGDLIRLIPKQACCRGLELGVWCGVGPVSLVFLSEDSMDQVLFQRWFFLADDQSNCITLDALYIHIYNICCFKV